MKNIYRNIIGLITIIFFTTSGQVVFGQKDTSNYYQLSLDNYRDFKAFNEEVNTQKPDIRRLNAAIFWVTNETRKLHNRKTLSFLPELEIAASIHSDDMVRYNFFNHINEKIRNRRTPDDRARIVGIVNPSIAENIIEGFLLKYQNNTNVRTNGAGEFSDPDNGFPLSPQTYLSLADELVKRWMNSKGHRRNILSEDALQMGVGSVAYIDTEFNDMPSVMITQMFQLYRPAMVQ